MASGVPSDPDEIVALTSWVRGVARRLAADVHEADDLAQEACLAALGGAASRARSPRAYLAGVLRNRLRMARRADARRRRHEERAAAGAAGRRPAAVEGAAAALERVELARELLERMLALEEPFRSVVLMRHGEELSSAEVAERLGIPRKTVESRERRGLRRLRERWLRDHGDDRALALLALPLGAPGSLGAGSAPAAHVPVPAASGWTVPVLGSLGAIAMQTKLVALVVAVAGGAGALWVFAGRSVESARPPERARVAGPAHGPSRPPLGEAPAAAPTSARPEPGRRVVEAAEGAGAPAEAPPVAARRVRGRVLDVLGRPVAGVAVVHLPGWDRPEPVEPLGRTTSGAGGRFELSTPVGTGTVRVDDEGLVTLVEARVQGTADLEVPLVVARHRPLAGRVVDERGRPLPGARTVLVPPEGFLARFDAVLDSARLRLSPTSVGDDGRFAWPRAPLVEGLRVEATLEGRVPASVLAPPGPTASLELVLARPADEGALHGRVLAADGSPASGAWVSLGARSVVSDLDGVFALPRAGAEDAAVLRALAPGSRPARLEAWRDATTGEPAWPDWIELRLGPPPLALTGRVVDEEGAPRPGVRLWVEDATPFGVVGEDVEGRVEYLLGAGAAPSADPSQAYWYAVDTDAEGRFALGGLLERAYMLRLLDVARCETLVAGPFRPLPGPPQGPPEGPRAGREDGLEIVFPRAAGGALRGRIVSRSGAPVEGVLVFLDCATYGGVWTQSACVRTGSDGRFAFEPVGDAALSLLVRGEGIVPVWDFLEPEPTRVEHELVVDALCHAKVELADPVRADAFRVLDADGEELRVYEIEAGGVTYHGSFPLVDGRSRTVGIPESAATLVLERAGEEVLRTPIRLRPGAVVVLSP